MKKLVAAVLTGTTLLTMAGCTNKRPSEVDGKVSFILGLPGGDGLTPQSVVDSFLEKTKDKYDVILDESSWEDFDQKVRLQFAAKNDVTSVFFTDSLTAPSFGAMGALEDISDRVEKDLDTSLYSNALYALSDDEGHLWGVPHGINPIAMLYNKDIFDAAGVPYPEEDWTFDDMLATAEKLTSGDVYGISYGTNITQGWLPFFIATGAEVYKDGFRNSNLLDSKVKEAFEKYTIAYNNGSAPHQAEIAAYGKPINMFAEGKIAMLLAQATNINTVNGLAPDLNYDAQIMPIGWSGKRPCIFVPNVWCMYSGSTDAVKDAAWEWIKHYLSEESQMIVAEKCLGGYPVMRKAMDAVANNGLKPENKAAFYEGLDEHGSSILENPCSFQVENVMQDLVTNIRDNVKPMDDLIKESYDLMQRELDYYYESL